MFVVKTSKDSLQRLYWANLDCRQVDIFIQYLDRHLDRQGEHRKVLFCQPKALQNETLPAHSATEIAGRVHFERVTFSSPSFFFPFCHPAAPFYVGFLAASTQKKKKKKTKI